MGWRDYAKQVQQAGDNRDIRDDSSEAVPIGPIVPNVPPLDPARAARLCQEGLAGLDWERPLHGLPAARWRQLLGDAHWLLDHFGGQAFRDGWTVGEMFGLWPDKPGWGGIADRLQSSRSLKMTADRATWRCVFTGAPEQFNRTAYPDLQPLWEARP